ncbi:MAG: toxin-activating lysine-acyltransferase [Phaeospirillum sp.]|nr:toxin-activating lysine-acyltransferase [Phaeospirillum sp.]
MTGKNSVATVQAVAERGSVASPPPTSSQVLGDIVFLAMKSPEHRHLSLADFEQAIMPALMLRQFRLWRTDTQPIAFASWACASDAVAARLEAGERTLSAAEWQSGERKVLIGLIAPYGGREGFERALQELVGGGK